MRVYHDPDESKYMADETLNDEDLEYKHVLLDQRRVCFDLEEVLKKFNELQEAEQTGK